MGEDVLEASRNVMKALFLSTKGPQGWLPAVGLAFKYSSELMLPESRNVFGNAVPEKGMENFELVLQYITEISEK